MNNTPPLVFAIAVFVIVIGLPLGLYLLFTRGRRNTMREIRQNAEARGWRFRLRRWQGNPTAFRIEGATSTGLNWVMKSGGTRGYNKGWSNVLGLRISVLAGEVDFAILPHASGQSSSPTSPGITPELEARVASFSGALASGLDFFQHAQELPSGAAEFDAAYKILVLANQFAKPPVDSSLAGRFLHWPSDSVAPHSVLAWRDAFGFCLDARLPAPATWNTISYLASLAEELSSRLPAPIRSGAAPTVLDRLVGKILGP